MFFDTTYRTNKDCHPFGAFIGFNHHYQQVVFGASLLYNEIAESFVGLLCYVVCSVKINFWVFIPLDINQFKKPSTFFGGIK